MAGPQVDIEKLISEMEVDLMMLSVQKENGFVDRFRMALMLVKMIGPNQVSELGKLKELLDPVLRGDLYVVAPISLSWVNEGSRQRMREAIGESVKFRENLRKILAIEGSVPHVDGWS